MSSKLKVFYTHISGHNYQYVWDLQEQILAYNLRVKQLNTKHKCNIETVQVFITCEHYPVYTLGKSGDPQNLLLTEQQLQDQHIEYHKINRGGDITYHGPGQITGYPLLDLEQFKPSAAWYIEQLERLATETCKHFGIDTFLIPELTGVWIDPENDPRKICAIGVKMSRWLSIHGYAFNVKTDLNFYEKILPCGIDDKGVTSLENELKTTVSYQEVLDIQKELFSQLFNVILEPINLSKLEKLVEHEPKIPD